MIDIHMHVIPRIDDGSCSIEMSEEMLKMAVSQGVDTIITTSHSEAFAKNEKEVKDNYQKIKDLISSKKIPVKVYLGSEVYCEAGNMDAVIEHLTAGRIPSMNGTKYVLTEFYEVMRENAFYCVERLLAEGWIPILAHVERYLSLDIPSIKMLKEKGCLVQLNVYSVCEESQEIIRERARKMLEENLADFMGSDAHRTTHRPPAVEKGIAYLYENYEKEYVDRILFQNAEEMLVKWEGNCNKSKIRIKL
ncbi:MAG: hypothetical protein IJ379_06890 [Lachnospiraceae bacterium]|nr:hypothetical protein [Lachnospiraceae bacterium]MBQ7775630.1 hypothetical protein [Lachnospiraceae bacterium]